MTAEGFECAHCVGVVDGRLGDWATTVCGVRACECASGQATTNESRAGYRADRACRVSVAVAGIGCRRARRQAASRPGARCESGAGPRAASQDARLRTRCWRQEPGPGPEPEPGRASQRARMQDEPGCTLQGRVATICTICRAPDSRRGPRVLPPQPACRVSAAAS